MTLQKYPIGVQTFSSIIEDGYNYVDKTHFIPLLVRQSKFVFLSRPRRFGKSVMLSTLEAYFEGRRELFKGLAIYDMDVDWTSHPVLHFDFNAGVYDDAEGLLMRLDATLGYHENKYGLPISSKDRSVIPIRFENLIRNVYTQTGRKVVILVDEYDKPLLGLEEDEKAFESNQKLLKSFFGCLKSMDRYIRFCFVTGVARFSKVSIFSDMNNLDDISMDNQYADICGWTEAEMLDVFQSGIEALASERGECFDNTLKALRDYYDGYLFTPKGSRLYNPYSVLRALKAKEINPFWFGTGTPTFLVKRVKSKGIAPTDINGQICTKDELLEVGLGSSNPIPLMFQTGYLTIDSYDQQTGLYKLRFPNIEVEIGFYRYLFPLYIPENMNHGTEFEFSNFKKELFSGQVEEFMKRLATLLKALPGDDHCESTYRAITYLLCTLCGTYTIAENRSYKGRSDLEVLTPNYIYIFEFKYNKSVEDAMAQIYSRDYAGPYALDSRQVYLIGANLDENKDRRGLTYKIEKMEP